MVFVAALGWTMVASAVMRLPPFPPMVRQYLSKLKASMVGRASIGMGGEEENRVTFKGV